MNPEALQRLYTLPWAILPTAHKALEEIARIGIDDSQKPRPATSRLGKRETRLRNGTVRHIDVCGPIIHKATELEKWWYDATSHQDISRDIEAAADDPGVDAILLHIDSPGGTYSGSPELGELVASIDQDKKPILAHSDGMIASGAYWLASQCRHIHATKSAHIGCVGVYTAFLDMRESLEARGLHMDINKNTDGVHKAAMYPGTSLTGEQREALEMQMDEIFRQFSNAIINTRGDTPPEALNGFTYLAETALPLNLIDAVEPWEVTAELALEEAES